MKADYLSYRRATAVSVLGLVVQSAVGLVLLVTSVIGKDSAMLSASLYALVGVLAWLTLAVMFDQRRRERLEAMEAESLARADAKSASVFEEGAQDLRVAAKRLASMQRVFVPAMALLMAALLIGLGAWRFAIGRGGLSDTISTLDRGWSVSLAVGAAFVSFVFARYVAGMARNRVWAMLQGGAVFAAGTAMLMLLLVVGHFVDLFGPDTILRAMRTIIPIVVIALGCEIVLSFVLDLYRPRKADEVERLAIESRALGLIAAPDRVARSIGEAISYQLGVDITQSWQHKLLQRWGLRLVVGSALVLWGLTCFEVVHPHQRAMLLRFGSIVRQDVPPGLVVKAPWPIDQVVVPAWTEQPIRDAQNKVVGKEVVVRSTTGVRTLDLGGIPPLSTDKAILWTNVGVGADELQFIVQPASSISGFGIVRSDEAGLSRPSAGDALALLGVEVPMRFVVRDPFAFEMLGAQNQRQEILLRDARRVVLEVLGSTRVDELMGPQRRAVEERIRAGLHQRFIALNALNNPNANGQPVVDVIHVGVQGVRPARISAPSFEMIIEAEQRYQALLANARGEATATLVAASGDADLAQAIVREINELLALREKAEIGQATPEQIVEKELAIRSLMQSAGGESATLVQNASSDRWRTHMDARGKAARYAGQVASYVASPSFYMASLYLDALGDALSQSRVYIVDDNSVPFRVRFNVEERASQAATFEALKGNSQN